jgi:hypothetical protein
MSIFQRLLLTILFVLALGCASDSKPLWADPGLVRLAPDHTQVAIEIHNVSGTIRPVGEFELVGEDWGTLRFVDDSLPRTVPANDSVVVRLEVSAASFRSKPNVYRSGQASLRFRSNQHEFEVPIEFVGTEARGSGAPPLGLSLVALALLGLAVLAKQLRTPSTATASLQQRLVVAAALAALLLLVATIPFGNALCLDRAGIRVGAAELAQCRAGLGGYTLTMLPASPGVWWWLIAPALVTFATASLRARADAAVIGLLVMRTLGLAIVLASFATALAPASATTGDYVLAQLRSTQLFGLDLPAWGLLALPLACAAMVALVVPARASGEPMLAALERFERLLWAALIATLFFGGWSIPGVSGRAVPWLSHAGLLALELAMFALKVALIDLGLARLGKHIDQSPAALLRIHARWTVPILLLNLVAVALWRST